MSCFKPGGAPAAAAASSSNPIVQASPSVIPQPDQVKLSQYASGLGCACKLKPQSLEAVLHSIPESPVRDPNLLVGIETGDDAAIYKINEEQALVLTTDFFPPIVDDAETFGRIAAANAMSDVYAKGGHPISALSLVGFPSSKLPLETLSRILKGATAKCAEAGIIISGGHTIDDVEPKFGLAVTGMVHPQRFFRNVGARPGDSLILTKAIGTGVITTSMKKGFAPAAAAEAAMQSMMALNKAAQETLCLPRFRDAIHAVTDVTGFGLVGHLRGMVVGSHVSARLDFASIPQLPGALELLRLRGEAAFSTGSRNNMSHVAAVARYAEGLALPERQLVCDAQTSGGLLVACDPSVDAGALVEALRSAGCTAARIGTFIESPAEGDRIYVGLGDAAAQAAQTFVPFEMPAAPAPPPAPYNVDHSLVWFYKNAIVTLGNEELGGILAKGIMGKLLTTRAPLPGLMLFLGDAVELTTINDNTVATLQELERRGVTVWSCSTCLNHLKLMANLRVGRAVTADEVAELLASSPRIVTMS